MTFYEKGKKYNCRINGVPYYRKTATIGGKQRSFYGDGEKDAIRKVEEAKALATSGVDLDKKTALTGDVMRHWLYDIKRTDKDLKASSFARYEMSFRNHILYEEIAKCPLSKLTAAKLQSYATYLYEGKGLSNPSITATFKLWRMFIPWAVEEGYLSKNIASKIILPGRRDKGKKDIETFTEEEREKIYAYMRDTDYQYDTIILLAFATGMRQGELLGLRWDDITQDGIEVRRSTAVVTHVAGDGSRQRSREVWDTKTINSERTIPIREKTRAMLEEHRQRQTKYFGKQMAYVFTTDRGSLIDQSSFRKSYERMLERAGVPYRKFHAIRHTFATEAIRRGVNVKDLQTLLGHSDIATTYVYVHSSIDSKTKAIDRLGDLI